MILGMDWLVKYGDTIDWKNKLVTFKPAGEDPFVFQGSRKKSRIPLVTALRTRDLLNEGCTGFLASVVDTKSVTVTPSET